MTEIRRAEDFAPALGAPKDRVQATYIVNEALVNHSRTRTHTLSLAARPLTMRGIRDNVEAGGLMSGMG